jgi:kynurenine formamidase
MPIYPGIDPPVFETPVSIEKDGFVEKKITLYSHTGTHMDAPAHIIDRAMTLDAMAVERFGGEGFIIDISGINSQVITLDHIHGYEQLFQEKEFALIYSGWCHYWDSDTYFRDYPVLDSESAKWITSFNLKGIGIDMIPVDAINSMEMPIHKILLNHGLVIVENLANLELLIGKNFSFMAFPLKIEKADGSPVRAVAKISD